MNSADQKTPVVLSIHAARNAISLRVAIALVGCLSACSVVSAQEGLRVGFISTFTGPQALLGQELLDGFKLGLDEAGGKLGGIPTTLVVGDDQAKPDIGRQLAEKMISRDKVQVVTGVNFSNVLLALAKPVLENGTVLLSVSAGPSLLAGKQCSPLFFSTSWQNDGPAEAMGAYLEKKGVKDIYVMAPNFPAGKDVVAGFKRFYKGVIKKEVYTQFEQLDYAAEIADIRSQKPGAVFFFYPGSLGINFLRQYADAGLAKTIPLYGPSYSFNETIFGAVGDAATGAYASTFWTANTKNTQNEKFVADFMKAHGRTPSEQAMQAYDAARLLDASIRQIGGKINDSKALAAAMRKAPFDSVRGNFKYNKNGFPIQDYYISRVEKDAKGKTFLNPSEKIFEAHADAYAKDCQLP